jgi:two-component system, OmpR family, response regulator
LSKHILVVDDEARIREVVQYALRKEGYVVTAVAGGRAALEITAAGEVDLVVLDVMLPDLDGLEVCRRIRAARSLPILFLSAKSEEVDRIVGLELGGDDYLTKPFSPRELVARVRAIFRRSATAGPNGPLPLRFEPRRTVLSHDGTELDPERPRSATGGRSCRSPPPSSACWAPCWSARAWSSRERS